MPFNKDIVADYACPTNGSSSCTAAFQAWRTDAQSYSASNPTEAVNLTIPGGHTYNLDASVTAGPRDAGGGIYLADRVKNLTITATGATITDGGGAGYAMGVAAGAVATGHGSNAHLYFAKTATVSAGSSTVTLLDTAKTSLFAAGNYAYMSGFVLQSGGNPQNHAFFEYAQITNVNAGTGVITFSTPLRYSYKSTWPEFNTVNLDGGPAALYQMDPAWDTHTTYIGGTWNRTAGGGTPIVAISRHITFNGITPLYQIAPTQNKLFEVIGGDWSGSTSMECDKAIETATFENVTVALFDIQSSSIERIILKNGATMLNLNGTPRILEMQPGSSITTLGLGAYAFGACDQIIADGAHIPTPTIRGVIEKGAGEVGVNNDANYSMSGGVIRAGHGGNPLSWAVPDHWYLWEHKANGCKLGAFKVTDVTHDATYVYVTTNLTGGFPNYSSAALYIRAHPASNCQVQNSTGLGTQLSKAGAFNKPIYSYWASTFTQATMEGEFLSEMWGNLTSMTATVSSTSGLPNPSKLGVFGAFKNFPVVNGSNVFTTYPAELDLRTAGSRIATPTAYSTPGGTADAGIDFRTAAPMWMTQATQMGMSSGSLSGGTVSLTMEVITDQGIPSASVSPRPRRSIEVHGSTYRGA